MSIKEAVFVGHSLPKSVCSVFKILYSKIIEGKTIFTNSLYKNSTFSIFLFKVQKSLHELFSFLNRLISRFANWP